MQYPDLKIPLSGFLQDLKSCGFDIGIHSYLQVQKLLHLADTEELRNMDSFKGMLSAILVKSPENKNQFDLVFEKHFISSRASESSIYGSELRNRAIRLLKLSKISQSLAAMGLVVCILILSNYFVSYERLNETDSIKELENPVAIKLPSVNFNPNYILIFIGSLMAAYVVFEGIGLIGYRRLSNVKVHKSFGPPFILEMKSSKDKLHLDQNFLSLRRLIESRVMEGLKTLSIPKTIRKTIDKCGFPSLTYDKKFKRQSYLFIVQANEQTKGWGTLLEKVLDIAAPDNPQITIVYFTSDPRICIEDHRRVKLEKLINDDFNRVLIFLARPDSFINRLTNEASGWSRELPSSRCLFLDIEGNYDKRAVLKKVFKRIQPFTMSGLLKIFGMSDNAHIFEDNGQSEDMSLLASLSHEELKERLGQDLYNWLCCSVIHPKIEWPLIISIGASLEKDQRNERNSGFTLLTFNNLHKLLKVPWLRTEVVTDGVRNKLLEELDPRLEQVARKEIIRYLSDEVLVPLGSYAHQLKEADITANKAALNPDDEIIRSELSRAKKDGLISYETQSSISKRNTKVQIISALGLVFSLLITATLVFKEDAPFGSVQVSFLLGASYISGIGIYNGIRWERIEKSILRTIAYSIKPILIILLISSLKGIFNASGISAAFLYYTFQILPISMPFLVVFIMTALTSWFCGSWTSIGTIGIVFMSFGIEFGLEPGLVAGTIISGVCVGELLSPFAISGHLAASTSGVAITHQISAKFKRLLPAIVLSFFFFLTKSVGTSAVTGNDLTSFISELNSTFNINVLLVLAPIGIILIARFRNMPLISTLLLEIIIASVLGLVYQYDVLVIKDQHNSAYQGLIQSFFSQSFIGSPNETISEMFVSQGIGSALNLIWLVLSVMTFIGACKATGINDEIKYFREKIARTLSNKNLRWSMQTLLANVFIGESYSTIALLSSKVNGDKTSDPIYSGHVQDTSICSAYLIPWSTDGIVAATVLGVSVFDFYSSSIFLLLTLGLGFLPGDLPTLTRKFFSEVSDRIVTNRNV